MKKHVVLYGLAGGLLIGLLRLIEYRWLVVDHSIEIYGGVVAATFAALGIWLGNRMTRSSAPAAVKDGAAASAPSPSASRPAIPDASRAAALGVTPRELEILRLMAAGMSNREIAEALFVSENTVKTHSSRLFEKLGARRRTQAVQLGRERALIP